MAFSLGVDTVQVIQMDVESILTKGFRHTQRGFRSPIRERPSGFLLTPTHFHRHEW